MQNENQIKFNLDLAKASNTYDHKTSEEQRNLLNQYQKNYQFQQYLTKPTNHQKQLAILGAFGSIIFPIAFVLSAIAGKLNGLIQLLLMALFAILSMWSAMMRYNNSHFKTWPKVKKQVQTINQNDYLKYFISEQKAWLDDDTAKQKLENIPPKKLSQDDMYRLGNLETRLSYRYDQIRDDKKTIALIWDDLNLDNYVMIDSLKTNTNESDETTDEND